MKKLYYHILSFLTKLLIIFVPDKTAKQKMRTLKNEFLSNTYDFLNIDDYSEKRGMKIEHFPLGNNKVSILNNFYVSAFEDLSYLHDDDKNILIECASYKDYKRLAKKSIHIKTSDVKHLKKAVVFALETETNYWHFTFHCVDKVINLEESGFDGKYIIFNKSYIKELLQLMGISDERVIAVERNDLFKVEKLYVIDDYFKTDYIALQKAKRKILSNIDFSNIDKYPKKIFVRRVKPYTRTVINEKDVLEILKKYGYETIIPDVYPVSEQIKYFYAADIVVTPHGANSTNALYMKENSRFIECFGFYYITPCMLNIIKENKMFYNMIVDPGNDEGNQVVVFGRNEDYKINLTLLEDTIYNL